MNLVRQKLTDYHSVGEALVDLCGGLCTHDAACLQCDSIRPDQMPEPFRGLLVHHDHMTSTLGEYFRRPVELSVLGHELDGDLYRRRIVLTLAGTDRIVEFGIVRIDLSYTSDEVRAAILDRSIPLGEILIEHDVLRRIDPRWYLRVDGECPALTGAESMFAGKAFGRVATIYCNQQPAIELLEIVMDPNRGGPVESDKNG